MFLLFARAPSAAGSTSAALDRIAHADSLIIGRVVFDSIGTSRNPRVREAYGEFWIAGRRSISGDLCRRLASRILDGAPLTEGRDCAPVCLRCSTQVVVRLDFPGSPDTVSASVYFRERDLRIHAGDVAIAHRAPGAEAESLLALIREAMPDDSALQAADPRHWTALAPDREPDEGDFVDVDDLPLAVHKVTPQYPQAASAASVEGRVTVHALIGSDGRVERTFIRASIPALDEAASTAVRKWRFRPARCGGRPVPVWVAVPVDFRLH